MNGHAGLRTRACRIPDPHRPRPRGAGPALRSGPLERVLERAGLAEGAWGRVTADGATDARALRPLADAGETARLHRALRDGAAAGRPDVAAHLATIVATHLAAAVPLGTLLAGEPLHLPEPDGLAVALDADGWPTTLHVETARPHWSSAEAATAARFLVEALSPVVDTLATLGGRGRRSLWNVVSTRIAYIGGEHAGRVGILPGTAIERLLEEAFAAAAPHVTRPPAFRTYRHARGSFRTVVFRGCCLGYRSGGEGCPFCPRLPAERQTGEVVAWLDSLPASEVLVGIPVAS